MKHLPSILSCSLGNILEWYDFGLFTIFSSLFSRLFFPTQDPATAMIATFGIFAIGFFCRPLGALIFGYLGDRIGRAKTLRWSILVIAIPTLLIGILPTYEQINIAAPILLVLVRMCQGVSIGGEYSGNMIYLAETSPSKFRATLTAFASTGANLGILLAAVVGLITSSLLSESDLASWGWRLPYLISGILCILLYTFRLKLHETTVFEYLKRKKEIAVNPIKVVFKHNLPALFRTVGMVCMGSTFYFFSFVYVPIFLANKVTFSVHYISGLMTCLILIMVVLTPLAGLLCDYLGRRKMLLFNAAFVACIVIPGFYLMQSNYFIVTIFVLLLFSIASSLEQGTTSVAVVENFPLPARYTGLSLGYNLGNGFLGGTIPIVAEWLVSYTHLAISPAIYVSICAMITWLVVFFFVPETKGRSLT